MASALPYIDISGNTGYSGFGLYATFSWSLGFYLFIVGTILYFIGAGLVNYFISLNGEDGQLEPKIVEKRETAKNYADGKFCKHCGTKL